MKWEKLEWKNYYTEVIEISIDNRAISTTIAFSKRHLTILRLKDLSLFLQLIRLFKGFIDHNHFQILNHTVCNPAYY